MKKYISLGILMIFVSSCTTINIKESDLFDVKRTIEVEDIEQMSYKIDQVRIKTSDSIGLEAWFIDNPNASKTVLYFGGNGFVIQASYHIITTILRQNVDLLVFNYRGYGNNNGVPSIEGLKRDALAAYNYLVEKKDLNPENILLHGHSMGTFLASYTANQKKSNALVLESPVTDLEDWSETVLPWFLKPFLKFEADSALLKNSNLEQIKKLNIPLLLITGKDDNITPPQMAEKLYQNSASSQKHLFIIEKGGHNNLPEMDVYGIALNRFYNSREEMNTLKDSLTNPSSLPE